MIQPCEGCGCQIPDSDDDYYRQGCQESRAYIEDRFVFERLCKSCATIPGRLDADWHPGSHQVFTREQVLGANFDN